MTLYRRDYLEDACWWHAFKLGLLNGDDEHDWRVVGRLMQHFLLRAA